MRGDRGCQDGQGDECGWVEAKRIAHLVDDATGKLDANGADEVAQDGRVDGEFVVRAAKHLVGKKGSGSVREMN